MYLIWNTVITIPETLLMYPSKDIRLSGKGVHDIATLKDLDQQVSLIHMIP